MRHVALWEMDEKIALTSTTGRDEKPDQKQAAPQFPLRPVRPPLPLPNHMPRFLRKRS